MQKFKNDKEKLSFIIHELSIELNILQKDIATTIGMSANMLSEYLNENNATRKLKTHHINGILSTYDIPINLFTLSQTEEEIKEFFKNRKSNSSPLKSTYKIPNELENLIGTWYLYSYPNNMKNYLLWCDSLPSHKKVSNIYEQSITIYKNTKVIDLNKNVGILQKIGSNQSIIFIEDRNTKESIVYTFDNARVNLNQFLFSKMEKNQHGREILSFGYFSRQKLDEHHAYMLLGKDIDKVQLKVCWEFLDRLSSYNDIEEY